RGRCGDVDRAGRAELRDADDEVRGGEDLGADPGALLAHHQHGVVGQRGVLDRLRPFHEVDGDQRSTLLTGPGDQVRGVGVVDLVLVAVGDHRATPVPAPAAHDVEGADGEGVGGAHHRADVRVVLEVLDRDVQAVAV